MGKDSTFETILAVVGLATAADVVLTGDLPPLFTSLMNGDTSILSRPGDWFGFLKGGGASTTTSTPVGGSVGASGVKSIYANGKERTDFTENPTDGMRLDFKGLGTSFASCEYTAYVSLTNAPADELSFKMGGGAHQDGSTPKCYDIGIDMKSGAIRIRGEEQHPNGYFALPGSGKGTPPPADGKFIGYKGIKKNEAGGVVLEVWEDAGNNETAPSNQWKQVFKTKDTQKNWATPPSDHQETFRVDKVGSNYKWKWVSIREITGTGATPTVSETPATAGGTSTTIPPAETGKEAPTEDKKKKKAKVARIVGSRYATYYAPIRPPPTTYYNGRRVYYY